ncbi:MAG: ABC transporter permease, partial [Chitinispirillaceae bacterium]|nr:ABC transporter permease [Chitinispirillaceae bacterium]
MNRVHLMIWKEFAHIRADELSVRLMVFPVFVMLFVLSYALTSEVKNIAIAVVDQSRTPQSLSLLETVRGNRLFRWKGAVATEAEARDAIDRGAIKVALVIPPTFAADVNTNDGGRVQLLVDGGDANSANVSRGYLSAIISGWAMKRFSRDLEKQGVRVESLIPVTVSPVILFNPLLKPRWYMVPALVVLLVTMITGILSGLSIVREKESGTLEQLMVTPIEPYHVIIGKTIPYVLIGLAEMCVFLLFAVLWFRIPFHGNFFVFLLFGVVYMMSSLGIGIFTSTVARTPQQVLFLIFFVMIFFILLSGFFFPIENMPRAAQYLSAVTPVRYFMFVLRAMFLKGAGLAELWRELLYMTLIGMTVFGAAVALFHRRG